VAVRRWDDLAKKPDLIVPPLEAYEEVAYECLLSKWFENFADFQDLL
jgi:hypothetical protein